MGATKAVKATEIFCPYCRQVLPKSKFYLGLGVQNPERLPICKDCCKLKIGKYSAILNGDDMAAFALFGELGIPFIKDAWQQSQASAKSNRGCSDQIESYLRNIRSGDKIYQGFWDSDTSLDELRGKKKPANQSLITDIDDLEALELKWGKYDDPEAYRFLERTLDEYTEDLYEVDNNLLARYKDLCILEYIKRKTQEKGDISEIAKVQDRIDKQLKLLKLDEFQTNTQTEDEKHIEYICWEIENTRPAECEDLEKYKDFSGFGKTMEHIMRCCKNLVCGSKDYPDLPRDD